MIKFEENGRNIYIAEQHITSVLEVDTGRSHVCTVDGKGFLVSTAAGTILELIAEAKNYPVKDTVYLFESKNDSM